MKRPFISIGLLLCTLVVLSPAVMAAHVHFLQGPTFTTSGGALTVSGRLAGLGNQDVTIVVSAVADVTCVNQGGNPPPGQRQTVTGSVSNLHPENGNLSFSVTTGSVSNPCPDH